MRLNHWLLIIVIAFISQCKMDCKCEDAKAEAIHPALLPPNGKNDKADVEIGATLTKWEDVLKLGKLYQDAKEPESRNIYFDRLLVYFKISISDGHLIGMKGLKRSEIEAVFGKGSGHSYWNVPHGTLAATFKDEICIDAVYDQGF